VIADLQTQRAQRLGDDADLVLVRAQRDDGALGIELLLEDHDLALDLVAGASTTLRPSLRISSCRA
jgi:hypothetical protein